MPTATVQHIAIWRLKEPGNAQHVHEVIDAIERLSGIPGVIAVCAGPRAETSWPEPDREFHVGMIVSFESMDAVVPYLTHEIHLDAIAVSERLAARVDAYYFHAEREERIGRRGALQ